MKKIIVPIILVIFSFFLVGCEKNDNYKHGLELIEKKEWERATTIFTELGDYKDSKDKLKEIIYLSNFECINDIGTCGYEKSYESARNLLSIKDYKDTKNKINSFVETLKTDVKKDIDIPNSVKKDYNDYYWASINLLEIFSSEKEYSDDLKPKLCEYGKQMFNEGFVYSSVVSIISKNCDNYDDIKNNKYYVLNYSYWNGEKAKGELMTYMYSISFINDAMNFRETAVSLYATEIEKSDYSYKVYKNAVYSKLYSLNDYSKKFDIVSISDKEMKIKYRKDTITLKK